MQSDNLIKLIVGAALGVLLFASFAMPLLIDSQAISGDPITYTNGGTSPLRMDYYEEDFTMTYADDTVTLGDYSLERDTTDYRVMYWEYGRIVLNNSSASTDLIIYDYRTTTTTSITYACTIEYDFSESTITVVATSDSSTVTTITAETVMAIKEDGDYAFIASTSMSGVYYTQEAAENGTLGFLDTYTTYNDTTLEVVANIDGVSVYGLPDGTEYTASVEVVGGSLVDGTTDVYTGGTPTFTIVIGDDTITEATYRFGQAALYEIDGHKSSGAMYDMVGLLPLLLVVALVLGIIASAVRARLS